MWAPHSGFLALLCLQQLTMYIYGLHGVRKIFGWFKLMSCQQRISVTTTQVMNEKGSTQHETFDGGKPLVLGGNKIVSVRANTWLTD